MRCSKWRSLCGFEYSDLFDNAGSEQVYFMRSGCKRCGMEHFGWRALFFRLQETRLPFQILKYLHPRKSCILRFRSGLADIVFSSFH